MANELFRLVNTQHLCLAVERILELAVIYACVPRKQHERDTVPHMERQRFSNTLGLTTNGMRR
jgi:hypothetical protein